jgi:outer membrane protein OmpA-like peptidoglycan-associated protein
MKKLTVILISLAFLSFAQNESNIWYFGQNAGIDFSTGSPVVLTQGMLSTTEGVASLCNEKGELLFYTDGITVRNAKHGIMKNGEGLKGDPSSTQSAVAILKPGTNNIYYLFTVAASGKKDGLTYSIIDMNSENSLGEIKEKNNLLHEYSTEKITAVKHRNNKDIWLISHPFNSNEFHVYLINENGLIKTPIISSIGIKHEGNSDNSIGYMKVSPDGSQCALAIKGINIVEIFDFDNSNGKLSNPISLSFPGGSLVYGIEFSSNGSLLYISAGGTKKIYQYNLMAGSNETIAASGIVIGETEGWAGALQIAKDEKIYISPYNIKKLDVIEFPNKQGIECSYKKGVIDLLGKTATLGFPTFIQSYFTEKEIKNETKLFSETKTINKGETFVLSNIYFETDKYELKSNSFLELNKLIDLLKKEITFHITISGHTDNVGNKSYNLKLSENRAKSVANFLISKGIDASRITSIGMGNSKPILSNESEVGRKANRRVEFYIN